MDNPLVKVFTLPSLLKLVIPNVIMMSKDFGIFAFALSDDMTSAIISFTTTFFFIIGCIFILPLIFGEAGVWIAVPVAEGMVLLVALFFVHRKRAYGYLPQ